MKTNNNEPSRSQGMMAINRILVPTDFSDESRKAMEYAVAFAKQFKATVTALFVVEPVSFVSGYEAVPLAMDVPEIIKNAETKLTKWLRSDAADIVATPVVREGKPYVAIIDEAKEKQMDLIIISTHGYSGVKHLLMGSTAERVVRHAPCPVLVVRQREHEFVRPAVQV